MVREGPEVSSHEGEKGGIWEGSVYLGQPREWLDDKHILLNCRPVYRLVWMGLPGKGTPVPWFSCPT